MIEIRDMLDMKKESIQICQVISPNNGFLSHTPIELPPEIMSKMVVDFRFYTEFSQRLIAPFLLHFYQYVKFTDDDLDMIGHFIYNNYKTKWERQLDIYKYEYSPIYNYSDFYTGIDIDTETTSLEGNTSDSSKSQKNGQSTSILTGSSNGSISKTSSSTDTKINNLSDVKTETRNLSGSNTETRDLTQNDANSESNNIFGFNSPSAVGHDTSSGSDKITETGSIANVNSNTGTITNNLQKTGNTSNTSSISDESTNQQTNTDNKTVTSSDNIVNTSSKKKNEDINRLLNKTKDYKRLGNIGNIATQDLIKKEIDLWRWKFIDEILEDLKTLLTMPFYS